MLFVQSVKELGVNGYWILFDHVTALDYCLSTFHPNSKSITTVTENQEYEALISDRTTTMSYADDVKLTVFLGTSPDSITEKNGLIAAWSKSFVGRYLEARYSMDNGKRQICTVFFPHNDSHPKAHITRISGQNYTGAAVGQGQTKDLALESSGTEICRFSQGTAKSISFQALAMWCRQENGNTTSYFLRKGRHLDLDNGDSSRRGVESDEPMSVYLNGHKGRIISPGTLVTYYCPGIRGVRLNGEPVTMKDTGTGWVRFNVPSGSYQVELVL
jgi:hypothetical protein